MLDVANLKKGICTLKLEKLKKVYNSEGQEDVSLVNAVFSIIDFSVSGNKQVVSKEVCLNSAYSLKYKPLLCQYFETTDFDEPNDNFGSHGEYKGKLRNGEEYILNDTHAIGVSEKEGYLGVIKDEDGNDIDVLLASFMLWKLRYPNEIALINEFYEKGESLYTSCEYYYSDSEIKEDENGNKYEEIKGEIIFDGHCCLGKSIPPAYKSSKLISFNSKWNKALNTLTNKAINSNQNQLEADIDINKNIKNKEEENNMENRFLKSLNNLSFGDIRDSIYAELSKVMIADEYFNLWISMYNVYADSFVYETYVNNEWVYYKVPYTKSENDVITVDFESKVKAEFVGDWVAVTEYQTSQNALKEAQDKIVEKDNTITSLNSTVIEKDNTINTLTSEKETLSTKFNEATNSITELSKQVNEMKPIVDIYNTEKLEKILNEKKSLYEGKFKAVNAVEKFNSPEIQNLIKLTVYDNEDGKNAVNSLNSIITDSVALNNKPEQTEVKELGKSTNNLIDVNLSFEKRYGFDN